MCGIISIVSRRPIVQDLLAGLKRLEYRGYDSSGLAIYDQERGYIQRLRASGKIIQLENLVKQNALKGTVGVAHTRWATHGSPVQRNAHPHSTKNFAVVHNGIIENYLQLKQNLINNNYKIDFSSETDTEVVVHLADEIYKKTLDLKKTVFAMREQLTGNYALGLLTIHEPQLLIGVAQGNPLVIGLGIDENYLASDPIAFLSLTNRFIVLEEGDVVFLTQDLIEIYDKDQQRVERTVHTLEINREENSKGQFRHYMLKEIHEQPQCVKNSLESLTQDFIDLNLDLAKFKQIQIVACGSSYHAGLLARYWIEALAKIPCQVDIASEFRYRDPLVLPDTLFLTISQSGETADTLAALKLAKQLNYSTTLTICNVPQSSLMRLSEFKLLTRAGSEIGVATTKGFTTQLVALFILALKLAESKNINHKKINNLFKKLKLLPEKISNTLKLEPKIVQLSDYFVHKNHVLFLGRWLHYGIAAEGTLKFIELSYIPAAVYPAGELKHGPLALIDESMPVIALVADNLLFDKIKSNLQEIRTRGGELILLADKPLDLTDLQPYTVLKIPMLDSMLSPILHAIVLQLLAYYVALNKGTDVDQPRNLAKSVTVE